MSPLDFFYTLIILCVWATGPLLLFAGLRRAASQPPRRFARPFTATLIGVGTLCLASAFFALPIYSMTQVIFPLVILLVASAASLLVRPPVPHKKEWAAAILLLSACLMVLPLQLQTAKNARRQTKTDAANAQIARRHLIENADFKVYLPQDRSHAQDASFIEATDGRIHYRMSLWLDDGVFTAAIEQYNPAHTPYTQGQCGLWASYDRGQCRKIATSPQGIEVYGEFLYTDSPLYAFATFGSTRLWIENWRWLDQEKVLAALDRLQPVEAIQAPGARD